MNTFQTQGQTNKTCQEPNIQILELFLTVLSVPDMCSPWFCPPRCQRACVWRASAMSSSTLRIMTPCQ